MAGPDELTRTKFGADFAHDDIPSEAVINSAKEKRARMLASGGSSAEDFIALGGASGKRNGKTGGAAGAVARWDEKTARGQGPHPESRLMREEDELGEGDDELAEYTGAQERMPLGKKAEAAHEARRKEEMREALADGGEDAEMDEEDEEWEQAQMRRNEMPGIRKESRRSERVSPV